MRYFVSQHLGKAKATVWVEDAEGGQVRIDIDLPSAPSILFKFDTARLAQRLRDAENWQESVTRMAINQLHKQLAGKGAAALSDSPYELAAGSAPWMGDLADSPYGGATSGYGKR